MSTFSCPFISITFMWSNIQICSHLLLPNYIWYIFFMFMGIILFTCQNCHFNFHSKESSSQLKFNYREFKTIFIQNQRFLLQKVLVNKFLEHDGMRVLSSALFSSCMIGYTIMTTLSWQKCLLLQRSQPFVRKNLFFMSKQRKHQMCLIFLCVTLKRVSLK